MKKKIYICMSILMVLFLSLTMVHANESTTYRLSEFGYEISFITTVKTIYS